MTHYPASVDSLVPHKTANREAMPQPMSRQARRLAERQAAKGRRLALVSPGISPAIHWGSGLTSVGLALAEVLPTHEHGNWQLGARGWVSERDAIAWHEAAHATVALVLGKGTVRVGTEGFAESSGGGGCRHELRGTAADLQNPERLAELAREQATIAVAGATIVGRIRLDALGLSYGLLAEALSLEDLLGFEDAKRCVPEPESVLRQHCAVRAIAIVNSHRHQFAALVNALLAQGTLDETDVLAIWNASAPQDNASTEVNA